MSHSPLPVTPTRPLRVRLGLWLAVWALCMASTAPTVSRVLAWAGGGPTAWGDICSAHARPTTGSGVNPGTGQPGPQPVGDACAYCSLLTDRSAPPSALPSAAAPAVRHTAPGGAANASQTAAFVLPKPPSHAPPGLQMTLNS